MYSIRTGTRMKSSMTLLLLIGAAVARPVEAQGITPVSLDSVVALRLDSVPGVATAYFRPVHRARGMELHSLLAEYLEFYRKETGVDVRMRIAVLDSVDWSRVSRVPYGLPNNSGMTGKLLLAAAVPPSRVGVRTLPPGRIYDALAVGHEGGHLLVWALMPDRLTTSIANDTFPPDVVERLQAIQRVPSWYWEFAANYLTTAFLEARHPDRAKAWHDHLREIAQVPRPKFTHLADWYGAEMRAAVRDSVPYILTVEGGRNQGWYQGVVGLAAEHVHRRGGLALIAHIRRMASGEKAPTTGEITQELEATAPGFIAVLDSLGAGHAAAPAR